MSNQIKQTTDYNYFKFSPLNRKPSIAHVDSLIQSIKRCNQLDINPIIVNYEGYIISGQHRFLACRKMGLPVYYIEKDVPEEYILIANQKQRGCSISDAVEYYVQKDTNRDYLVLQKFMKEFNLNAGSVALLIGETGARYRDVQQGKFQLKFDEEACYERMRRYRELYNFLSSQPFDYKGAYKNKSFCGGLSKFLDQDDYDWDIFMKKVRINWAMLDTAMPTASKWTEQFIRIYNKRTRLQMEAMETYE